jgi:hypothetical protein
MTEIERTTAGWQLVMDGCHRRTMQHSTMVVGDHGQGLLGFYDPPSDREIIQHQLTEPLRPRRAQKAMPADGIFGQASKELLIPRGAI